MSTLQRVSGQREWQSQHGTMVSIRLNFGDFEAELTTKPETLVKRLEMLEGSVGKDSPEWAFQDTGTFTDGKPKPQKVTNYPGKAPAPQGPTAKREYVPRYTDTEEGWRANDERVDRRAALAAAQAEGTGITLQIAEKNYNWLRQSVPAPGIESPTGHAGNTGGWTTHPPEAGTSSALGPRTHALKVGAGSSGSSQVSARGESDPTSAPRVVVSDGEDEAAAGPVEGAGGDAVKTGRVGADTFVEGGPMPADSGKVPGAPSQCLHTQGVFEKRMANGDRVSYCSECKAKVEVVKA